MIRHVVNQKIGQVGTVPKNHTFGREVCKTSGVESLEALVRRRLRAIYLKPTQNGEKWTAEKLAPFLGMKDPSGVRKLLNGDNTISLAHIEGFCAAFQVSASELVAPDGAQLTYLKEAEPTLVRLFREMDAHERLSLLNVLQWRIPMQAKRLRKPAWGRAELTEGNYILDSLDRLDA